MFVWGGVGGEVVGGVGDVVTSPPVIARRTKSDEATSVAVLGIASPLATLGLAMTVIITGQNQNASLILARASAEANPRIGVRLEMRGRGSCWRCWGG